MGTRGGSLLLVNPATGLSGQDVAPLDANRAELYSGFVFGGTAAVPAGIDKQLGQAIAGPLGAVDGSGHRLAASSGVGGVGGAGGGGSVGGVGTLSPQDAAGLRSALPQGGAAKPKPKLTPSRP